MWEGLSMLQLARKLLASGGVRQARLFAAGTLFFVAVGGQASAFTVPAPELSPGSMASALTLLTTGALLLAGRVRAK